MEIELLSSSTVHTCTSLIIIQYCCLRFFCIDYDKAEALGKEYSRLSQGGLAEVPNSVARPNDHPFFVRLRPELVRVYDKLQRENDLM